MMKLIMVFCMSLFLSGCVTVPQVQNKISTRGINVTNPLYFTGASSAAFNTFGYGWCGATSLLRQAAIVSHFQNRELKLSEAYIAVANCIVPFAGGYAMKKLFDAHPEWDKLKMINNNNNY